MGVSAPIYFIRLCLYTCATQYTQTQGQIAATDTNNNKCIFTTSNKRKHCAGVYGESSDEFCRDALVKSLSIIPVRQNKSVHFYSEIQTKPRYFNIPIKRPLLTCIVTIAHVSVDT